VLLLVVLAEWMCVHKSPCRVAVSFVVVLSCHKMVLLVCRHLLCVQRRSARWQLRQGSEAV
jgi:hypothetical protein